jgi:hypothetical protein
MERKRKNQPLAIDIGDYEDGCDLDALLHPAQAFEHPCDVVNDPDLTLNEKRAILASWASDACAIEAAPNLRCVPGGKRLVRFDDVIDALRALDKQADDPNINSARYQRVRRLRQRSFFRGDSSSEGQGNSLN